MNVCLAFPGNDKPLISEELLQGHRRNIIKWGTGCDKGRCTASASSPALCSPVACPSSACPSPLPPLPVSFPRSHHAQSLHFSCYNCHQPHFTGETEALGHELAQGRTSSKWRSRGSNPGSPKSTLKGNKLVETFLAPPLTLAAPPQGCCPDCDLPIRSLPCLTLPSGSGQTWLPRAPALRLYWFLRASR